MVASVSAAAASPLTSATSGTIAGNYQTFLGLLTTQLKNQSPLDPLDTNQFTQQLVQFAAVEQQLKTNDSLAALLAASKSAAIVGALGLAGAEVTAEGATTRLNAGSATWSLTVPRAVSNAAVTIKNAAGSIVQSETRAFSAGTHSYAWNGRTSTGATAPDGEYTVNVAALDSAGKPVVIRTEVQGVVGKVDVTGTEPLLSIGSVIVPLSKVKTIQKF